LESESPTDVNEVSDPNSANVWAEHSINVHDANFLSSLAAGLTTIHVLPGSSTLFGGRTVVLKNVPASTVQGKKFPGAKQGVKIACGSNPKGNFGSKGRFPSSRMGNVAGHREGWSAARAYLESWLAYESGEKKEPPARNFKNDTLAAALYGDLSVHIHCYRSGDMAQLVDMSKEFGFQIAMFHHAVESYKISKLLKANGICSAVWSDWWAFKPEAFDGIRANAAFIDTVGGCVTMHSDNRRIANHFTIEAAKAMSYGQRAGVDITPERALRWITSTPAKVLGIDNRVGSIAAGKDADVVVWSGNPFSVYSRPEKVFVDGALLYDRLDPTRQPFSDFELGQPALEALP
ncbi:MAG: amidohydrolase family protein, partial [Rhodospirillaceae bacterium]|nr:amidohydrolase family protein [Rhodospirillaceae bacterium]